MSNPIRKLVGQTAIYGLPSILGRLLNYLLVPLHTYYFAQTSDYGVISELYAWVAFLIVLLTFGMETAFFRFFAKRSRQRQSLQRRFLVGSWHQHAFLLSAVIFQQRHRQCPAF